MPAGTRTFRIFVSSTFGDLAAERAVLHESVFPALRTLCEAHGCRFQAIDLRWGVSQEAALDQRTMEICLREIARCQEVTPRPNFIILLGDRYGWRPLPAEIGGSESARLAEALSRHPRARALLDLWYRRDDNARPPVYVLQPRRPTGADDLSLPEREAAALVEERQWTRTERRLRTILQATAARAGFPAEHPLRRFPSATEQEIEHGALTVDAADERVFCFFRNLRERPAAGAAASMLRRFLDTDVLGRIDADAAARQQELKARLRAGLTQIVEADAQLREDGIVLDHLPLLATRCREALDARIRHELERLEAEPPLVTERKVHDAHRRKLAADFVPGPRTAELDAIAQYLATSPGTLCAVTGAPGSGK